MKSDFILLFLAVFPVIVLSIFIYSKDKFEKEPVRMLVKAFLFGCFSVVPAVLLEQYLMVKYGGNVVFVELFNGYVVAGGSEELCKLVFLYWAVWKSKDFNEYFDGIVYATFLSLGFACVENILYVFQAETLIAAVHTSLIRAILSVPAHFLFAVLMGYYFALAKFEPQSKFKNLFLAFLVPMLLHGSFDTLLFVSDTMTNAHVDWLVEVLLVLFVYFDIKMWKWGVRRVRALQEKSAEQHRKENK